VIFHALRARSLVSIHRPLRVAINSRIRFAAVVRTVFLLRGIVFPPFRGASRQNEGRTLRRARAPRNLAATAYR